MTVTFSEQDLQLFSEASGDRNPLHLSASYAGRTSFGQPVVFGVLGILACLGEVEPQRRACIKQLVADFHRPMFAGVEYTLTKSMRGEREFLRVFDGSINVLSVTLQFGGALQPPNAEQPPAAAVFRRREAATSKWQELVSNAEVAGTFRWDQRAAKSLIERFNLLATPRSIVEGLLWSSYVVGMELPGESALFFRLVFDLTERSLTKWGAGGFQYDARIISSNEAIHQVKIRAELRNENENLAEATILAFARQPVQTPGVSREAPALAEGNPLQGKIALVLGASRGFGAAAAMALAQAGMIVVGCSRSVAEWESANGDRAFGIEMIRADAANAVDLTRVSSHIKSRYGRLDLLVCSAFPPIPALRLEENALGRLKNYISAGTNAVLTPLCVFLGVLNESAGTLVLISSSALEEPVREWPHYLAAKAANESLTQVAQLQYERINTFVFRPNRMITDMTNTPMGRANAAEPNGVAADFVQRLIRRIQDLSTDPRYPRTVVN